jgi:preprotein translocase subunit SecA
MGLFSWLFGRPSPVEQALRVWLGEPGHRAGVFRELDEHLAAGRRVLLVAQFPATLATFRAELDRRRIRHDLLPAGTSPAAAVGLLERGDSAPVLLGLARELRPDQFPSSEPTPGKPVPVVVLEQHPLRAHDEEVVRFAEGFGRPARVVVHTHLDTPLMKMFAGDWVRGVLRQLGMKDDEAIGSKMVARRVRAAQDQIAGRVRWDADAESAEEWLTRSAGG